MSNQYIDKALPENKETAHTTFQSIAFAYAILSDPIRRKRYDKTGSTSESLSLNDDDDFSFAEFYAEQFRDVVTDDAIDAFAKTYKGSEEERVDVLAAYERGKGAWGKVYESVMLSDSLVDEERFRGYIDTAIEGGSVQAFKKYVDETQEMREKRLQKERVKREKEAKDAVVAGEEIKEKKKKKKAGGDGGLGDLAALIRGRQADRGATMLDRLEAKYAPQEKKGRGKGRKRASDEDEDDDEGDEPSEEAFQAARKKLKKGKSDGEDGAKKSKRAKR